MIGITKEEAVESSSREDTAFATINPLNRSAGV